MKGKAMDPNDNPLYRAAIAARERAMALYSGFRVGAALECADGTIVSGCNIESASYGLTICAERTAIFKALSEGEKKFGRILVVADTKELTAPCGACRQVLWDFAPQIEVIIANLDGDQKTFQMKDLFPNPFGSHLF
jgi:cytidine deaminase